MQFRQGKKGLAQPCPAPWYPSFHPQGIMVQIKNKWGKGRETHLLDKMSAQQRVDFT